MVASSESRPIKAKTTGSNRTTPKKTVAASKANPRVAAAKPSAKAAPKPSAKLKRTSSKE